MKPFLVLVSLLAGAGVAYLSVIAALWYVLPVFLIIAGVVAVALDGASRWRIAAFSVGVFAVFFWEARAFVIQADNGERVVEQRLKQERERKSP